MDSIKKFERNEIVEAFKNGKEIEFRSKGSDIWLNVRTNNPSWDWEAFDYRIKEV